MTRENAKHFLPLVAALAEGKTIQWNSVTKWRDIKGSVAFSCAPSRYRIKPVFDPPKELFFVEYDWMLQDTIAHFFHPTPALAQQWLDAVDADNGHVIRFVLDDSYTPPTDPVEGWVGVYESGAGTIHQHRYQPIESRSRTRVAKIREVLPRVRFLHHDPEKRREWVTSDLETPREDHIITHQYVEDIA